MPAAPTPVVLTHLLDAYPAPFTLDELLRELRIDPDDVDECDALARAVRDLLSSGLLQRHGDLLLPTRAAVHSRRVLAD
jgi:hypothetical protein